MGSRAAIINLVLKLALAGLIVFYLAAPDLDQFDGKVMPLRASLFPVAASLIAVIWLARRRPQPYPHGVDALVTAACIVDFGGNAAHLYSTQWFETAVHFANMVLLATAFGLMLAHLRLPRPVLAGLALGFGAVLHTIWEIAEYHIDTQLDAGLDVTNAGIVRDLVAGLIGSSLAATLVWWRLHDRTDLGGRLIAPGSSPPRTAPDRVSTVHPHE